MQSLAFSHTHLFQKGHVNQLRFGYTRRGVLRSGLLLGGPASGELGIPGIPTNAAFGNALPAFLVDGLQQLGSPLNTNSDFTTDATQIDGASLPTAADVPPARTASATIPAPLAGALGAVDGLLALAVVRVRRIAHATTQVAPG